MRKPSTLWVLLVFLLPAVGAAQSTDLWIAASAHVAGGFNSNWRTDVWVYNPGASQAAVSVYFLQTGLDKSEANLARPPAAVNVPAGNQVELGDILKTVFNLDSASGALYFSSPQLLKIVSRTYNKLDTGEYGQFIGSQAATAPLTQSRLVGATGNAAFRTNMGLLNPSRTSAASVTLNFLARAGQQVQTATVQMPPFTQIQYNDIFAAYGLSPQENMTVVDIATSPVFGYLSVVDNLTNDPIFVPGLP
jgi:hypothetical protein